MTPIEFQNVWCSGNNFAVFVFTHTVTPPQSSAMITAKQILVKLNQN